MSGACSQGSAASTSDSSEPDTASCSSANPTSGDETCCESDSVESPSTTMCDTLGGRTGAMPAKAETGVPAVRPPSAISIRLNQTQSWGDPISYDEVETLEGSQGMKQAVLISSAEASPARTSPSPADEPDSCTKAAAPTCSSSSHGSQMSLYGPAGMSSLRTFPDSFPATPDEISPSYERRWPSSGFWTGPGECWTADTSECPSDGGESSSLRDVLEDEVPAKYFLSPRAAAGILRRAEKRGRTLPEHLAAALESVAGRRTPNV
jgi:hypothetical protein